jgi:hypothetical protein
MRVLVNKRTHPGDPDRDGVFEYSLRRIDG